ncbi:copper resistance protein CopD [Campylobacter sp. FMV-PI01]|uniref:Copper resistance protein CopD n=1 Tax=Campylobacter portucalensis TaxID=2608384 RepID=A0A6L5WGA4_9BACT|nr:copper resistance protein CopD [Campylobacter portucalensis]MSN96190.1 copper resistance protein CopD [Campylobacter portucalensis]
MQIIYPYAQIIHLFCAIIFVGYLFFDVVILKRVFKNSNSEFTAKIQTSISNKAVKIMPICVALLILTGGMMMSSWVNSNIGYFATNLQIIFMIKVILAFLIFMMVCINLTCKFILKKSSPLGDIHPLVLIMAFIIVLFAKVMFLV